MRGRSAMSNRTARRWLRGLVSSRNAVSASAVAVPMVMPLPSNAPQGLGSRSARMF